MRSGCLARAINRSLLTEFAAVRGFKVRNFISAKSLLKGEGRGEGEENGQIGSDIDSDNAITSEKRQRTGAVQDLSDVREKLVHPPGFGLRLSLGALRDSTCNARLPRRRTSVVFLS